jgi:hypothetical protein
MTFNGFSLKNNKSLKIFGFTEIEVPQYTRANHHDVQFLLYSWTLPIIDLLEGIL